MKRIGQMVRSQYYERNLSRKLFFLILNSLTVISFNLNYSISGVAKVRPAGHMRPSNLFLRPLNLLTFEKKLQKSKSVKLSNLLKILKLKFTFTDISRTKRINNKLRKLNSIKSQLIKVKWDCGRNFKCSLFIWWHIRFIWWHIRFIWWHIRFTTVSLKAFNDQSCMSYQSSSCSMLAIFKCGFSKKVICAFLHQKQRRQFSKLNKFHSTKLRFFHIDLSEV